MKKWLPLLLTGALALFLYTLKLSVLPSGFHGDEGETAVCAREILEGKMPFIGVGWFDLPLTSFWPQAVSFWLFGSTIFSARLPAALFGALTLFLFYFLVKNFSGQKVAVLATFLLATSHWWIALSRLATTYTQAIFLEITAFYFLFAGLKSKKPLHFILAGIFSALTFYSYLSARITILILAPFLLAFVFRQATKRRLFLTSLFVLAFVSTFYPLGIFFLKHPGTFSSRTNTVFIFSRQAQESVRNDYPGKKSWEIIWGQTKRTFNPTTSGGDNGGQYGYRGMILDPATLTFFLLGVATFLFFRQKSWLFVSWWFLATAFLGGILTTSPLPPFAPRLAGIFPVIFLFVAQGIDFGLKFLPRKAYPFLAALIIFLISFQNIKTYFWESEKQKWGDLNKYVATKIVSYLDSCPNCEALFLTAPFLYPGFGTIRFLSPQAKTVGIDNPSAFTPSTVTGETLFIIYPAYEKKVTEIMAKNPGGKLIVERNPAGQIQFFLLKISP